ncbi:MAG TPA: hypothetical protein VM616_00605 [Gammaproteobacteria bacterium]|nr:hypothetical protein [Gammaproteobacteria bacterium]
MSTTLWVFGLVALIGLIAFVSYMRRLFRESREAEKRLDYSKMRKWEDEDG